MYTCCCIEVESESRAKAESTENPVARKEHHCHECGDTIVSGEKYERHNGLYDDHWVTHITCSFCLKIRNDYFECGFYYGQLVEDFRNCNGWDYTELPEDEDE